MARSSKVYASLQQVSRRFSQGTEGSDEGPTSNSRYREGRLQVTGGYVVLPDGQRQTVPERRSLLPPGGGHHDSRSQKVANKRRMQVFLRSFQMIMVIVVTISNDANPMSAMFLSTTISPWLPNVTEIMEALAFSWA